MFEPDIDYSVPMNTLKYKCLVKLTTHECLSAIFGSSSYDQQNDDLNVSSTLNVSHCKPIPISIIQLILDLIARERRIINTDHMVSLLGSGGCYSFTYVHVHFHRQFSLDQMAQILPILANCKHLHQFTLYRQMLEEQPEMLDELLSSSFQHATLVNLKSLTTNSSRDLISILPSCPNLVKLEINSTIGDFKHNQIAGRLSESHLLPVRLSLRQLCCRAFAFKDSIIEMIALFPNLEYFKWHTSLPDFDVIHQMITGEILEDDYIDDDDDDLEIIRRTESVSKVFKILSQLKGVSLGQPLNTRHLESLVTISTNLEELHLVSTLGCDLKLIANLEQLKRLTLKAFAYSEKFESEVIPLLQTIGPNLETLSLRGYDAIILPTVGLLCPNLKHFTVEFNDISLKKVSRSSSDAGDLEAQTAVKLNDCYFTQLESLRLIPNYNSLLKIDPVFYMLKNSVNIELISLHSCLEMTDDQFNLLISINPMRGLRSLSLRNGHSLSPSYLNRLLYAFDKLCFLDCDD